MLGTLPGTTIEISTIERDSARHVLSHIFSAGGVVLSQIARLTGLEPHTIQNWVKRGFLSPPVGKKYSMEQVCRILNINLLKGALPLEEICRMMQYINGDLTSEADDTIDDTLLYFNFVKLAARARHIGGTTEWNQAIDEVMADYAEPIPGAKARIVKVLRIMLTAWVAGRLRQEAEDMLTQL